MGFAAFALALALAQAPLVETTVGMPGRLQEMLLPGTELVVAPAKSDDPLVLRIVATYPHGDAHRYELEFWALEAGEYDLREHLRRADGSTLAADELPALPVKVGAVLVDPRAKPHTPGPTTAQRLGGYTNLMIAAGVLWIAGLVWLVWSGRKRRVASETHDERPRTLAERLRPLVERARDGQLTSVERAQLELGLVAYWRRKLGLLDEKPEVALVKLREHSEAGPLLSSLERWLHEPAPRETVDVAALLAPYRNLPADLLDERGAAATR
jgi:hypothetical protein